MQTAGLQLVVEDTSPAKGPIRVLIVCRRPVVLGDLRALVRKLKSVALPSVVCTTADLASQIADLAAEGVPVLRPGGMPWTGKSTGRTGRSHGLATTQPSWRHRLKEILSGFGPTRFVTHVASISLERRRARQTFAAADADVLVVFDDRAIRPEMVWLDEAERLGLGRVLVAFASSSISSDVFYRRGRSEYWPGPMLGALLGQWIPANVRRTSEGHLVAFHEPWAALAAFLSGLSMDHPWVPGGGAIQYFAVHGSSDLSEPLAEGVPEAKLHVTGQASLDGLHKRRHARQVLAAELAAEYRFDPARPLIVVAVPHTAEHGMADWKQHQSDTEALFAALQASEAAVLLSLHPRSRREDYTETAARFGLVIARQPMADILPAADLLVAGASSTVRWATSLGIPAVITNLPGVDVGRYGDWPGVVVVHNEEALRNAIRLLVRDDRSRTLAGQAALAAPGNVIIDGRASERISAIIVKAAATGVRSRNDHRSHR